MLSLFLKWLSIFKTFNRFLKIQSHFSIAFFRQLNLLAFLLHIEISTILPSIWINEKEQSEKIRSVGWIFLIYFNALYACQDFPYLMHFNATWADTAHITRDLFLFNCRCATVEQLIQLLPSLCVNYANFPGHNVTSVMWAVQLYWLSFNKEWLSKLLSILTMRNENSIKCNSGVNFSKCSFVLFLSFFAEQFNNLKFESQSTRRKTKQAGKVFDLTAKERGRIESEGERERDCRHERI